MEKSVQMTAIGAGVIIVLAIGVMFFMKGNTSGATVAPVNVTNPAPVGAVVNDPSIGAPEQQAGMETNPSLNGAPAK